MHHKPVEPGQLSYANQAAHAQHDSLLLEVLKCITALDLTQAQVHWASFCEALEAHAALEEEVIFPLYADLGSRPRGAGLELFEADHTSFRKVINACHETLRELSAMQRGAADLRGEMVIRLKPFLRLRSVLEHHSLREQLHLYPSLEAALPYAEARRLRVLMERLEAAL